MKKVLASTFLTMLILGVFTYFIATHIKEPQKCDLYAAVYTPHPKSVKDFQKLYFEMTFEKPKEGDGGGSQRYLFLYIDAFDKITHKKVSTMRLGAQDSIGSVVLSWFTADAGQWKWSMEDYKELKGGPGYPVIALNKDLSKAYPWWEEAPYIFILDRTQLLYYSKRDKNIEKYVRFYDDNKTFPNFAGHDVWLLSRCNGKKD